MLSMGKTSVTMILVRKIETTQNRNFDFTDYCSLFYVARVLWKVVKNKNKVKKYLNFIKFNCNLNLLLLNYSVSNSEKKSN